MAVLQYDPIEKPCLLCFAGSSSYRDLPGSERIETCRENARAYAFPFTERHIQCVWYDASLRPNGLRSSTGETITVKDPGRWNLEAGPDFLDAVLLLEPGRRLQCGDVEVHIRPGDWDRHGHTGNPAYDRLAAHVTYFGGDQPASGLPPGILHIPLQEALQSNPRFSFNSIDTAAYPHAVPSAVVPPCAEAVAAFSVPARLALLEAAAQERLRLKALRMRHAFVSKGPGQVLYEEMFSALGYKHNRHALRLLASYVPLNALQRAAGADPLRAYALLLGVAGLLPSRPAGGRHDAETRKFIRLLWDHWWKLQGQWQDPARDMPEWTLSGVRPQNHPHRRIAAGAALFQTGARIHERIMAINPHEPAAWYSYVRALLGDSARLAYWSHRLSFRRPPQPKPVALLGGRRIAAIMANVLIPFVAAHDVDVTPLLPRMMPESDNTLLRHMSTRLFGRDHNPALYRQGMHQQGLIQIYHDFCLPCKGGCDTCRLPSAMRAWQGAGVDGQ